jgi:hypothetical protein
LVDLGSFRQNRSMSGANREQEEGGLFHSSKGEQV